MFGMYNVGLMVCCVIGEWVWILCFYMCVGIVYLEVSWEVVCSGDGEEMFEKFDWKDWNGIGRVKVLLFLKSWGWKDG